MNGFEKRELLGNKYWNDPRWKKVRELRKQKMHIEANSLVFKIRETYGLE